MKRFADGPLWTVGMALGYVLAVTHVLPSLYFHPRLGTWGWQTYPDEPSISWYGYLVFALLGGVAGGVVGGITGLKLPWWLALAVPIGALVFLIWLERSWF